MRLNPFVPATLQLDGGVRDVTVRQWKKNRARAQKTPARPRAQRTRKISVRPQPRRNARRTVAVARELSPLARLRHALRAEKIRFQVVGMSGAILQGARYNN